MSNSSRLATYLSEGFIYTMVAGVTWFSLELGQCANHKSSKRMAQEYQHERHVKECEKERKRQLNKLN